MILLAQSYIQRPRVCVCVCVWGGQHRSRMEHTCSSWGGGLEIQGVPTLWRMGVARDVGLEKLEVGRVLEPHTGSTSLPHWLDRPHTHERPR